MSVSTVLFCPGCGNEVKIPRGSYQPFDDGVGCMNTEEHEDGEPLTMYARD